MAPGAAIVMAAGVVRADHLPAVAAARVADLEPECVRGAETAARASAAALAGLGAGPVGGADGRGGGQRQKREGRDQREVTAEAEHRGILPQGQRRQRDTARRNGT